MKTATSNASPRITYLDTAKALGIFLVFYGHIVSEISGLGSQAAFIQYKFIFSFHMPFFFLVAGFFFRRRFQSLGREMKDLFLKRMLPVYLFGLIMLPLWPLYRYLILGYVDIPIFSEKVLPYLKGQPELNPITWFLVCLFTTEIIAALVLSKTRRTLWGFVTAVLFLAFGLYLTANIRQAEQLFGIYKNTWYIHEALVAFGFYALGYFSFPIIKPVLQGKAIWRFLLLILVIGITLATFSLNAPYPEFVVIIKESWHGNSGWFLISAVSGSLMLLLLATLVPSTRAITFIGKNTLILLGMNGIFHTFVNIHIATKVNNLESVWVITGISLSGSILSILLSVPVIFLLNRYLPQLVGRPQQKGPWLPALEE
ncbi:MAG TPA: hypothetical protein DEH25_11330 [Chloroflexi bacterium]|nr:hypothetical protein [Chloroflexota bacterium]